MELIVFDLDGTLLNEDSEITPFTAQTLRLLTKNNIAYTVATGRSIHSGQTLIANQGFNLPQIYSNGITIWNPQNNRLSLAHCLNPNEVEHIIQLAIEQHTAPFISTVDENNKHIIFYGHMTQEAEKRLFTTYQQQANSTLVPLSHLPKQTRITNMSMIGQRHSIKSIYDMINPEHGLTAYSGPAVEGNDLYWIDIHHHNANKGDAIEQLKQQLGVSYTMCFGDNENDLSMFAVADKSYAVDNAQAHIKAAADNTIGHHNEDGVANFLHKHFNL